MLRGLRGGVEAAAERAQAVVRRSDAEIPPERLGELRRLAVSDAARDLADGQAALAEHAGGAVHAHTGQMFAERGVADLGVGALELAARRGDPAGDVVEGELGGVLLFDDGDRVLEERRPVMDGGGAVSWHA